MLYRLAVEDMEPNHFIAYTLDAPGCFSSAPNEAQAISLAPVRIQTHLEWLARHTGETAPHQPIQIKVVETFHSFPSAKDPEYIVNAFFEDDRRPLNASDVEMILQLLEWTRTDLMAIIKSLTPEQLHQTRVGEVRGSMAGILAHVAGAENWYFTQLGYGFARDQLPTEPLALYESVRARTRTQMPKLVGDERVTENYNELWSARKIIRRTLWHERDHTQHIAQLLGRV